MAPAAAAPAAPPGVGYYRGAIEEGSVEGIGYYEAVPGLSEAYSLYAPAAYGT